MSMSEDRFISSDPSVAIATGPTGVLQSFKPGVVTFTDTWGGCLEPYVVVS